MQPSVRSVLVGLFVVALVLSTSSALLTERAYVATLNSESITVSVVGYEVDADGDEPVIRTALRVENPTRNRIVVTSVEFEAYADDTLVAGRPPSIEPQPLTVRSGEAATTTATIPIDPGRTGQAERAVERRTLRLDGYVWARIEGRRISIRLVGGPDG